MGEIVGALQGIWRELSVGLVLLIIIVTGYKGIWVWGAELQRCRTSERFWMDMALRGNFAIEMSTHATQVLSEKVTEIMPTKEGSEK